MFNCLVQIGLNMLKKCLENVNSVMLGWRMRYTLTGKNQLQEICAKHVVSIANKIDKTCILTQLVMFEKYWKSVIKGSGKLWKLVQLKA